MPDENQNSSQAPEPDFFDSLANDVTEFLFGKPEKKETKDTKDVSGRVEEPDKSDKVKKKRSGVSVNIGGLAKEIGDLINGAYERGKRDAESPPKKGKAAGEQEPESDEESK